MPVARALETVGEWWRILILRDAFHGFTRFDQFEKSLGIAPNILSRRLAHLTRTGMFERRLYNKTPCRYEYVLTKKGYDFYPVLIALFTWGNKHLAPKGEHLFFASRESAKPLVPVIIDANTRKDIIPSVMIVPGPLASANLRKWLNGRRIASRSPERLG